MRVQNENIPFAKHFDYVYSMISHKSEYIVGKNVNSKKLTKEPIVLHSGSQKTASFSASITGYWFVRGTDQKNGEVLVGQNGALFVLPE
jgi:hypothetical protein